MEEQDGKAVKGNKGIMCVEVLVSRKLMWRRPQALWPLSVYSLENHPIRRKHATREGEVFHFMVYDWERTIREALVDNRVPYSIIRYFNSTKVFPASSRDVAPLRYDYSHPKRPVRSGA